VTIGSPDVSIPAGGGTGQLAITTARECAWTANPTASWLSIRGSASGQGDGALQYVAAANPDPLPRQAAIEVNDQRASVTQAAGECAITLGSSSASFEPAGGTGTIEVRASSGQCPWTAVSDASWVSIRSGATGTGSGTVTFGVDPGGTTPRTATILVGGLRFAVTQSPGTCTFAVNPATFATGESGGTGTFSVSAPAGCPWTAASNVPWASVTEGASGSGAGVVRISVSPTSGPARSGSALIAGQSITLSQAPGCSFDVAPLEHSLPGAGGTAASTITTAAGCEWSASTSAEWIVFSGPTSGSGSGTLTFSVDEAGGTARSGTIAVAGRTITVTQEAGCAFSVSPSSVSIGASGGDTTVAVSGPGGCAWTASSNVSWITIASGGSGTGPGNVTLHVEPTTGGTRSAVVTIGGVSLGVTQSAGCTVTLTPSSAALPAAGGGGSFAVTAGAGCAWTATANDPWIALSGTTSGTGNGTVSYAVSSSTSTARTGTIGVGGATFTLTQGSGCTFEIAPSSANVPSAGGTGTVRVTAPAGCAWSATSNAPWIHVTAGGSGSGDGSVGFSVDATSGGARAGTLTIAGQTFTVNQADGCSIAVAPSSASVGSGAGNGSVTVTAGAGCPWTASSNADWLHVTGGASGSGNGTVGYAVDPNPAGPRTATLTIGGKTVTIAQAGTCAITIDPSGATAGSGGGPGNVTVTAPAGCGWSAASAADWITITSGASGSGNGTVGYAVAANPAGPRSGTLTIGGRTFTIAQDGNCPVGLAPAAVTLPSGGGSANIAVSTPVGCAWTAATSVDWLVLDRPSGSGDGSFSVSAGLNGGGARSATVSVGGQTLTVNQEAVACTYTVSPPAHKAGGPGGPGMFNVSTGDGCAWTATSSDPWITIKGDEVRVGNGKVEYQVDRNDSPSPRTGTIVVMGQVFTVQQDAGPQPR
jgi:hypothetical protein